MVDLNDQDRQAPFHIDGYGPGAFRIDGVLHEGPLLVTRGLVATWSVSGVADATTESLAPLLDSELAIELLLLGCGPRLQLPPRGLSSALRGRGIGLEPMDTGAACRTYNVLLLEERRVGAALLPAGGG